jgi:RNA polymerase sigma factor (sigma-70 family)
MTGVELGGLLHHIRTLAAARHAEDLSDAQLLEQFLKERDEFAFAALVRRHGNLVLGVCRRILHHHQDAEDAFQATFLVLAQKAASIRNGGAVGGWLFEVAYHTALAARSRASRRRTHERQAGEMAPVEPTAEAVWTELQPLLDEELHRLPEKYRLPLVLCYLEGKTNRQAAQELGWRPGSMSRRLARGRELLRQALARRGVPLSAGLLVHLLTTEAASATAPPALINTAVKTALLLAPGQAAAGAGSGPAITLAQGVLKTMFVSKLKMITLGILIAGLIVWGAVTRPAAAHKTPGSPPAIAAAEKAETGEPVPQKKKGPTKKSGGKAADESRLQMTVTGQVLGPDGMPVALAEVALAFTPQVTLPHWERVYPQQFLGRTRTDARGRFRLSVVRKPAVLCQSLILLATAKGLGCAWKDLDPNTPKQERSLRLPADRPVPVRLVDLQGQPAAQVKVATSERPQPPFWPKPVTTDARGRATLRSRGQPGVSVLVRDDRFAPKDFFVKVDPARPAKEVTLALAPPQRFEGVITYADTGKPAAGARVSIAGQANQGLTFTTATTDGHGHYRVNPNLGNPYWIQVHPPAGTPYLALRKITPWPKGTAKQTRNFALPRGVLVRGRITEKVSGKPVAGAAVDYRPHAKNSNRLPDAITDWTTASLSGPDGKFTIAVYPGTGHLLINASTPEYLHTLVGENIINTGKPGGKRLYPDALVPLDLPRKIRRHQVEVKLRRGVTIRGRVLGPGGRRVREALLLSPLRLFAATSHDWRGFPIRLPGGRFSLPGCDPEKTHTFYFLDPKNKWGAMAQLSPKKTKGQPVTVRLQPCGTAVARFVNAAGKPLKGFTPSLMIVVAPGPWQFDSQALQQGQLAAD